MDNSRIEGEYSIGINSAGSLSMDNRSLMRSDYVEQGSISLASGDLLMKGKSGLLGSNKIEVNAENKVDISGYSYLRIGWDEPLLFRNIFLMFIGTRKVGKHLTTREYYIRKSKTLKGITRLAARKAQFMMCG